MRLQCVPASRLAVSGLYVCLHSPAAHAVLEGCGVVNWRQQSLMCVCVPVCTVGAVAVAGPTSMCVPV